LGGVRLVWYDAKGEECATETALCTDLFSSDFETAPLAWRQSALVAVAAECLAGSPFVEYVSLADVALFARKIEPLVSDRAGWRDFIETIVRAHSLRCSLRSAF
jgi:hypothetical protein